MKLTAKLIGFLNRVFDKNPLATLALRLRYDGDMTWTIADGILTTAVTGGSGVALTVPLAGYTINSLATFLATQTGYSVPFVDVSGVGALNARALLDGSLDQDDSNGDHLQAYTSLLWAWMEPAASELTQADYAITQAPLQMSVPTAEDEWLDELGNYYAVARMVGEPDSQYAARMIASIGRPLGNNVAMEAGINVVTGGLLAKVVDAPAQGFTVPYTGTSYGLFDVIYSIALDGTDTFDTYTARVRAVVEAYRDAGTHMRSLQVSGNLADTYATDAVDDSGIVLSVGIDPSETVQLAGKKHNGVYRRDGSSMEGYDGTYVHDGSILYGWSPGPLITFNNAGEDLIITITDSGGTHPPEDI